MLLLNKRSFFRIVQVEKAIEKAKLVIDKTKQIVERIKQLIIDMPVHINICNVALSRPIKRCVCP